MLLEMMVNQKLLEQRAKEMDISVDEEVDAAIKRLREENNIPDDATLEAALRSEGSSMAELRTDFHRRIIQQKVLWNYVQGKVNITEEEIKNYYEKNKSSIMSEAITKVKRYTVAGAEIPKETLRTEAETVQKDLQAGKELNQGDYPHLIVSQEETELSASELDPKFVKILDATEVGSFTDPLELGNSFLILKILERKPPKQIPLEEARGRIYNILLEERAEKYQKTFLEDLRKQNYVVINQPS
jgi:peptidyl-prolyl cis-trans isomerase SurA